MALTAVAASVGSAANTSTLYHYDDDDTWMEFRTSSRLVEVGSVYWQTSVCLIGGCLNLINFAIFSQRQFSSATYILMAALSIVDAITLFLRAPQGFTLCDPMWCKDIRIFIYMYSLYVENPLTNMTENMSVWITVSLALERYIAMRHYNLSKTRCTAYNTRLLVLGICLVGIIFNLPFFFTTEIEFEQHSNFTAIVTNFTPFMTSPIYSIFSWIRLFLVQLIPLVFLCVCNCLLLGLVYRHNRRFISRPLQLSSNTSRRRSDTHTARKQRAQSKLTTLLVAIIFLFLFGQIPQAFAYHTIFNALGYCDPKVTCLFYITYRMVTQNLCLLAYSVTFFLYLGLNTHFRATLFSLCFKNKALVNGTTINKNNSDQVGQMEGSNVIPLTSPATVAHEDSVPKLPDLVSSHFDKEQEIVYIEEEDTLI